jgi:hypothetical protein
MAREAHQARRSRTPKTFTKKLQEQYLDHIRNGMRRGAAAEALKLPRKLVFDHIALHDDFEGKVIDAEGEALEHVEEALYQAAISGNVQACKMWLDYQRGGTLPSNTSDLDVEIARLNQLAGS